MFVGCSFWLIANIYWIITMFQSTAVAFVLVRRSRSSLLTPLAAVTRIASTSSCSDRQSLQFLHVRISTDRSTLATRTFSLSSSNRFTSIRLFTSSSSSSSSTSQSSSSSFSSSLGIVAENNISRLSTLQILLSKHGAPGSVGCYRPNGDLVPIAPTLLDRHDTPELISTLLMGATTSTEFNDNSKTTTTTGTGSVVDDDDIIQQFENLHPYLFPIAQSSTTGYVICAYRNPFVEEYDQNSQWPIVESIVGAPGFQILALNSEHLMKRIACECDDQSTVNSKNDDTTTTTTTNNNNADSTFIINLYNEGLGQGLIRDSKLDVPYKIGSVTQLGYGVDKYVLLRVGPFPDLYECMAQQHLMKGDDQSAMIALEACNTKFTGYASTFRSYSRLLSKLANRSDECRDAARMCLRMPLSTIGISYNDIKEIVTLGQMMTVPTTGSSNDSDDSYDNDDTMIAIEKMKDFYNLMRSVESDNDKMNDDGKSNKQIALEENTKILDDAVLNNIPWKTIRPAIAQQLRVAGMDDFANFVTFFTSSR